MTSSQNNKKQLWHYIKSHRQDNTGISILKASGYDHAITDPKEKADIFNKHFNSIFSEEGHEPIPCKAPSLYPPIHNFEITPEGVYNLLSTCKPHKSPGPDCIHPYALKATAMEITPILTHIFQQSLDSGTVPTQWKHAFVSPVFKKGNKTDPTNYRPISLTSVVCKIMEHILSSQIMKHLEDNNILSENQFGFRSNHSCESQLFITINDITKALNDKLQVDAAILDFSKAFDKVAHSRLLYKLDYYGIRGNLLNWFDSFLSGRSQQVVVEGTKSETCTVTSGVPQGSVLGPILFLIYINDITINVHSEIRLFADDILLYRTINSSNDHIVMQNDLNTLTKWANDWKMLFNTSKCNIIQFTTSHNKSKFTYTMNNTPLTTVEEHDYLGIRLHHHMSWKPHIDRICNKANKLLGFLRRNLSKSPTKIKDYIYKQLLLPTIEYCSSIWDPYHQSDIGKLEMIQHRAARFVLSKPWLKSEYLHYRDSITDMLLSLKWPSLEHRRLHARLMLLFKILTDNLIVPSRCLPILTPVQSTRAHHQLKLAHIQTRIDIYRYSFLPRTINSWNNLKFPNIHNMNLPDFKNKLSLLLLS